MTEKRLNSQLHAFTSDKLDKIEIAKEFISVNSDFFLFVLILTHCYVCTTASNPRD